MTNETQLISAINVDMNSLMHWGRKGQHPGVHIYGKWQNHAVYARYDKRYKDKKFGGSEQWQNLPTYIPTKRESGLSRLGAKIGGADMDTRTKIKALTGNSELAKQRSKNFIASSKTNLKAAKQDQKAAKLEYKSAKLRLKDHAEQIKNNPSGNKYTDKLMTRQLKAEKKMAKEELKGQKYKLKNAKLDQQEAKELSKNLRSIAKSTKAGEIDAIFDVGLWKGWSRPERIANRMSYYSRHKNQAKNILDRAISMIPRDTRIDNNYVNAYNMVVQNAYNLYSAGTVDKGNQSDG